MTIVVLCIAGTDPGFPSGGGANIRHNDFAKIPKTSMKLRTFRAVGGGGELGVSVFFVYFHEKHTDSQFMDP